VVVVGAGAAGLMAAIFAGGSRRRVLLLERTPGGGRKILISGGGRCNILPSRLEPSRFVSDSSPHTLRKILLSWPLAAQKRFFEEEAGIPLVLEPETGKFFPASGQAREVRERLVSLAGRAGAEIRFGSLVTGLDPPAGKGPWRVRLRDGDPIRAAAVILASGGLSVPGTGSDGMGLEIARRLGHTVRETYPALTPLVADPPLHAPLSGVSVNVILTAPEGKRRHVARGGFLFTHRGYSGPAVLDISHLATRSRGAGGARQPIFVQWTDLDASGWDSLLREGAGRAGALLRRRLPDRLARALLAEAAVDPERSLSQLLRDERRRLVEILARYPLPWSGDEGYRKAEVTGGGVALEEVDPRSLESRIHGGLFLCGEILDVFGPIGGHNFAWAWITGRAAGVGAAREGTGGIAPGAPGGAGG
jgi:predicted Rossmann fold flavoprotein